MIREILEAKSISKEIEDTLDKHEFVYLELKDGEYAKAEAFDLNTVYASDQKDRAYDIDLSDIKRVLSDKKEIDKLNSSGRIM